MSSLLGKVCEEDLKFLKRMLLPLLFIFLTACTNTGYLEDFVTETEIEIESKSVAYDEWYSTKHEVAEYIYLYEELPPNYLTKNEARELGWDNAKGNLWEVADGLSIGGDYFGNREGLLPEDAGRDYYEADINYEGGYRNAERIIFSNDGLIYYTDDHYESFEHLYGEE